MNCKICGQTEAIEIDFHFQLLPTRSNRPEFHEFTNYICNGCKVVYMHPQPTEDKLVDFYNKAYRTSSYALELGDKTVDTVVDFGRTIQGFQRFKSFYDIISKNSTAIPNVVPRAKDVIMDVGGYQGAFLSAATQVWTSEGMVFDYNRKGVEFAQRAFGFSRSTVVRDISTDAPAEKVRFVTSNHSFEHLRDPVAFLNNLRKHVLREDGYFYLEVPNVFGSHLSDPTHFYMYSKSSLRYTLEKGGFEVIDIQFSGWPREEILIGHREENLICLARPLTNPKIPEFPKETAREVYLGIRNSYQALSLGMLKKTFKNFLLALRGLLSCTVYVLLIDRMSYENGERVKRFIQKMRNRSHEVVQR